MAQKLTAMWWVVIVLNINVTCPNNVVNMKNMKWGEYQTLHAAFALHAYAFLYFYFNFSILFRFFCVYTDLAEKFRHTNNIALWQLEKKYTKF